MSVAESDRDLDAVCQSVPDIIMELERAAHLPQTGMQEVQAALQGQLCGLISVSGNGLAGIHYAIVSFSLGDPNQAGRQAAGCRLQAASCKLQAGRRWQSITDAEVRHLAALEKSNAQWWAITRAVSGACCQERAPRRP